MPELSTITDETLEELDIYFKKYFKPKLFFGPLIGIATYFIPELNKFIAKEKQTGDFPTLLEKMRKEKNIKSADLYKTAGVDKGTYSRMNNRSHYPPKKNTVIRYGLALKATQDEMNELLRCAGYMLTVYDEKDIIIRFCVEKQIYNPYDVDDLFYKRCKEYFFAANKK